MKQMAAHQFAAACPELEQSQALDPGIGTEFRLAECYEGIGRIASAWATYLDVAELARATGQSERERVARDHAASVAPRVSHLTVKVTAPDALGLEIRRGPDLVDKGDYGKPMPADPGEYLVTATAPGRFSWKGTVKVGPDGATQSVTVPALPLPPAENEVPPDIIKPAPPPVVHHTTGALGYVGVVAAGAGLAALGAGTVLGAVALSDKNSAESSGCVGNHCSTAASGDTRQQARNLGDLTTAFLVSGGALFAGGLTLWLVAPPGDESPRQATPASARLVVGPASLTLSGGW
jgi:hypothetical protein